jgi:tetratricopeptide (TPR) repeat protein
MLTSLQVRFLILFLFVLLLPTDLWAEEAKKTVDSNVKHSIVFKNAQEQPVWMQTWQRARKAANALEFSLAVDLYQQLLQKKPNIEEALREYALVLIDVKQWGKASTILQRLLELNPDSQEFLLYAGQVALHLKQYSRAVSYLGQIYTLDPNGPDAIVALRGQIQALQKQNHKELAYPLMEQLYLLVPHEEKSIRQLARYSKDLGNPGKAINYYTTLLNEFNGTDVDFLESEPLFVTLNDIEMAVKCWQGYLTSHPFFIPFHEKLSDYYLKSDEKEKALPHLLILIAHGEDRADLYLQIGRLYLYEQGRPDKALYYYDEYRKRVPEKAEVEKEISRIQAILANDLLVIVENEGAWNLWRDLAKVIPDRLAVYYSMAEQLQNLGKQKELREVLDIIHFHNPQDQDILIQLAQLTFAANDLAASTNALDSLDASHKKTATYLYLRAKISENTGHLKQALHYYRSFVMTGIKDTAVILHSMQLAGTLGYIDQLHYFYSLSQRVANNRAFNNESSLLYGKILLENALYSTVRKFYSEFSTSLDIADQSLTIIQDHLALILQEEEKYFAAEQELRLLLLKESDRAHYLARLVQNNLRAKDWNNAWKWHEFRVKDNEQSRTIDEAVILDLFIEKITVLAESGQSEMAIELAENFLYLRPESVKVQRALAELYFKNDDYLPALEILTSAHVFTPGNHLLLNLIEEKSGIVQSTHQADTDSNSLLFNARQYQKFGAHQKALESVDCYLEKFNDSLQGRVLKAKILQSLGDDFAALGIFDTLSKQYPLEEYFRAQSIKINFKSAKFANIIQLLDPDVQDNQQDILPLTKQNVLLLARAYWAQKNKKKALAIYAEFLQTPVDLVFSKKLTEKNLTLKLPTPTRSFLNHITFTKPAEPNRLRVVMSPQFTRDNMGTPEVEIVTSLYAEYRWQKFIQEELSVRQQMADGNYYQAMKDYQKMLKHNPSMESLFDLAGIYSRLNFLGKEAALYRIIQQESPGYPYLDEAMQRNQLKREPRVSPFYEVDRKEGRNGYFDNKQQVAGIGGWYMPSFDHELSMDYRRIYNQSLDEEQDLTRNRFRTHINWSPFHDLDFSALLGVDIGESDGQSNLLYDFRVNGRLGDMAEGFLSISQDVVDDTLESLKEGIYTTGFEGGLQIDLLPRLFAGGNYRYTDYSDSNYQNYYKVWSSYILHHEPMLLQLRYDYELSHNDSGNKEREFSLTNSYVPGDHPYWSQKEYWQHLLSISFEHQLTDDILGRGAPSYYSVGYSFGYEEGGYDNHHFNANIFLEISRHFLLNSSFEYVYGSEYEELDTNLSLIYRW